MRDMSTYLYVAKEKLSILKRCIFVISLVIFLCYRIIETNNSKIDYKITLHKCIDICWIANSMYILVNIERSLCYALSVSITSNHEPKTLFRFFFVFGESC